MAVSVIVDAAGLAANAVLAPERYHPRRTMALAQHASKTVADVAVLIRDSVTTATASEQAANFRILDTSHVVEGYVRPRRDCVGPEQLGSTKRAIQIGDVLVSRLRPYLRQIGVVDRELIGRDDSDCAVVCSTEFFVLRSPDGGSIAFLVPYFLTASVQDVFAAAVEGGHHPRFGSEVLLGIPIPDELLAKREQISADMEDAVYAMRQAEQVIGGGIARLQSWVARESGPQ